MRSLRSIILLAGLVAIVACGKQPAPDESSAESAIFTSDTSIEGMPDEPRMEEADELETFVEEPQVREPEIRAARETDKAAKAEKAPAKPVDQAPEESVAINAPETETAQPEPVTNVSAPVAEGKQIAPGKPTHDLWDELLRKYVTADGKVNYAGFQKDKAALESYLGGLTRNPVQDDWSRNEKMAYWINAYNAFTVKLIVDNYPVSSIMKLHNGKAWDVKWIQLGSKTYTLNNIENDILRPKYKDARIHFAVNCAAESCPPLLNRAFTADKLESQLEQQAKAFINNAKYNSISANSVAISRIFEWYAGDFGNIVDYLNKYSNTRINANATVKYQEYDWALNAK